MAEQDNPYQSPETVDFFDAERRAEIPWAQPFVSGHAIAVWLVMFLSATVVLQICAAGISVTSLYVIRRNIAAGGVANIFGEGHVLLHGMMAYLLLMILSSLATIITFVLWVHRTYANLPAIGAKRIRFSPNLAIGMFLVPVLNLFEPLRVVREIWRESDPAGLTGKAMPNGRGPTAAIIDAWWAALLIAAAFNLSGRLFQNVGFSLGEWRMILSSLFCSLAAIMAILIVRRIDVFQQRRYEIMEKQRG